ncbi:MAG: hypothetical protein HY098_09505 [Nitrospinae bacterium]|nr:hypothetical protein [Nitrospinota bacterium]
MRALTFWFFALFLFFQAGPAGAGNDRDFTAASFQFDAGAQNPVVSKKFDCKIKTVEQGPVRVITISSFISAKSAPDVIIRVISSESSVANIIYNSKMEVVAEYPKGDLIGPNVFLFKGGDEKRKVEGRWYLDQDYMMSDFSVSDPKGAIIYKETVIYQAKKPSRK